MSKKRVVAASSSTAQTSRGGFGYGDGTDLYTTMTSVASKMFGGGTSVTQTGYQNLDLREGPNHTTTGIPYAIHGTATLVQQRVATALGNYQDPIRLVLPTAVHRDRTIVIRRKFVVGGQAIITPERAPARTVAIREDQRTVVLTRYGGDLEMNLNLFLRPEEAQEEFDMKLGAQTRQLEQTLVREGYEMLLHEGTQLGERLAMMHPGSPDTKRAHSVRVRDTLFGCMQKTKYPLQNMMAAAKMAGTYTPAVSGGYNAMILPAGLIEMDRVTKPENMEFYLTGTTERERKQVNVALDNVYEDPRVPGMKLMIHQPFANIDAGSAYPVSHTGGELTQTRQVRTFYEHTNTGNIAVTVRYSDHSNHNWGIQTLEAGETIVLTGQMTVHASSAIMAVSGSDTGELLYAYPSTGISTSQTTESLKMQLRVYMGSALYDPTRVLVIPDVNIEGIEQAAPPAVLKLGKLTHLDSKITVVPPSILREFREAVRTIPAPDDAVKTLVGLAALSSFYGTKRGEAQTDLVTAEYANSDAADLALLMAKLDRYADREKDNAKSTSAYGFVPPSAAAAGCDNIKSHIDYSGNLKLTALVMDGVTYDSPHPHIKFEDLAPPLLLVDAEAASTGALKVKFSHDTSPDQVVKGAIATGDPDTTIAVTQDKYTAVGGTQEKSMKFLAKWHSRQAVAHAFFDAFKDLFTTLHNTNTDRIQRTKPIEEAEIIKVLTLYAGAIQPGTKPSPKVVMALSMVRAFGDQFNGAPDPAGMSTGIVADNDIAADIEMRMGSGRVDTLGVKGWSTYAENTGPLGTLDCPNDPRLHGQHVFSGGE